MTKRICLRAAAVLSALMFCTVSVPVSAEEQMTFRMSADRVYFTESELASGDVMVPGGMYIDNYTDIYSLKVRLSSDAPLTIENGDFTRDPSRTEKDGNDVVAKQCFFVSHGSTYYTGYSEAYGKLMNIALWYGPGDFPRTAGVVENPDSSFLSFDICIPQGTAAGVYRCYIEDGYDDTLSSSNLIVYDTDFNDVDVTLQDCKIIVEPAALRGDVNCDGTINVLDAQCALQYYSIVTLMRESDNAALIQKFVKTPYIHTAGEAADVSQNDVVDLIDAMGILRYSAEILSQRQPNWDDVI